MNDKYGEVIGVSNSHVWMAGGQRLTWSEFQAVESMRHSPDYASWSN